MSRHANHHPSIRCEITDLIGGPHPGCEEFASAVDVRCPEAATHTAKWKANAYGDAEKLKVCGFHASPAILDEPTGALTGIYRFRSL